LIERAVNAGRVRLSAVVLGELYAGTRSPRDKADLDVVTRVYQSLGLVITPSTSDWVRAGLGVRRYRQVYGSVKPRDHLNDILILLAGAGVGAVIVTENAKPFFRWATLLRRMGSKVSVREVRRADYSD
jgi:predicted nucleic acid-binding protein